MFRASPAFTVTAVAALALGIAANTGIFSVVNAVLLKPLSYPDPDRIVQFMFSTPGGPAVGASQASFNIWRRQTDTFQDVSAYRMGAVGLSGGAYPEQLPLAQATAGCLRLFGAKIERGRGFLNDEDRPGAARVAIITDELWRRDFGGDPRLVGNAIPLGGQPYTVIGILAPGFDFDSNPRPDVWIPFPIEPESRDQASYFSAAARLKPGVTIEAANARMQIAWQQFRRKYPDYAGAANGFSVERLEDRFVGDVRPSLLVLSGAVGLVLLMACANVANLLLIRALGRRREFAIRAALGAGRGRMIRQLLLESVLLSLAGGVLGLAASSFGVRALLALNPGDIPRIGPNGSAAAVDWRVLAFTLAISLATGLLFGLIPALQSSRGDLGLALKQGRAGFGPRQNRTRSLLAIGETALAVVLLIGSALLIRTFIALRAVDPGIDPHQVLTFGTSLAGTQFHSTAAVARLTHDAIQRIEALPGVEAVAAATDLPLQGGSGLPFDVVNRPLAHGAVRVGWTAISPDYFRVFRIPVVRGRAFTERDDGAAPGVALVNHAMARKFWPGADPIGQLIVIAKGYAPGFDEPPRQIVGNAGDVHDQGLDLGPGPMLYVPLAQVADGITALLARVKPLDWTVRTRAEPHSLVPAIQAGLRTVSGDLPIAGVRSMDEISARSTARQNFNMVLMTIFGGAALLLAALGIYALMAASVEQRRREIGIRLALGAGPEAMRNMIVAQGMRLALTGVAAGLAAALGFTQVMQSLLFGVPPHDPLVFTAVPAILSAVAFAAVLVPAIRATRVDPAATLRSE